MAAKGYKKYMKPDIRQGHPLIKIFIVSFFGMLLVCTFLINSLAKKMSVDTSIGDYKEQQFEEIENKNIVDNRLAMIQNEDQSRTFTELMQNPDDEKNNKAQSYDNPFPQTSEEDTSVNTTPAPVPTQDVVYKVYIGTYTSAEQAKVAKEIIQESGNGLNPIVKCLGSNNFTLQVGIFKNKQSAETLLTTIQKTNLPGRIVQEN